MSRNKILLLVVVFAILAVVGAWQFGLFETNSTGLRVTSIRCEVVAYGENVPHELYCAELKEKYGLEPVFPLQ